MLIISQIKNYYNERHFLKKLEMEIIPACRSVLDLGCGPASPIRLFSAKLAYTLGVDDFVPSLEESRKKSIHTDYLKGDVLGAIRKMEDRSFDCVLALDVIEHLEKIEGRELIKEIERVAGKKAIIYTPNGFLKQKAIQGNDRQIHLSGWGSDEMKKLGYRIFGMSGVKFLREEEGKIRFWPKIIFQFLSSLSQLFTYRFPRLAFQILCVKEIDKNKNRPAPMQ